MQNVSFNTVDEFLDFLPEKERIIVDALRELVFSCMPYTKEKLAYNVPYYYGNSRICFIWPSSVPWGKVQLDGVLFGFCDGHLLNDEIGYLDIGDRKVLRTKTFFQKKDIDIDLLRTFLFEAIEIDNSRRPSSKR